MNIFEEALKRNSININDFEEGTEMEMELDEFQEQLIFFERWLELLDRNASDKEKHLFLTKNGFVSEKQFNLWAAITDDYQSLEMDLDFQGDFMQSLEIKELMHKISEKKNYARRIKDPKYYSFVMRSLGQKDISPYGEDILKINKYSVSSERTWTEDDFRNYGCMF